MKNAKVLAFFFVLAFGHSFAASAQKTATWKGGTPGKNQEWNCPANWKEGRVPDEFSAVVIPDVSTSSQAYPHIRTGEVEVFSVNLQSGAEITLENHVRLIALEWNCAGVCRGCEMRVLVEGTDESRMSASTQK